jgi:hypothetical protein
LPSGLSLVPDDLPFCSGGAQTQRAAAARKYPASLGGARPTSFITKLGSRDQGSPADDGVITPGELADLHDVGGLLGFDPQSVDAAIAEAQATPIITEETFGALLSAL